MKKEVMKELNLKQATEKYNDLMWSLCYEHNTIGTRLSENTENWNLRDMVSECQYVLDCCYEEGNLNNEGQHPDYWEHTTETILNKAKYDYVNRHNDAQKELHKYWLSKTRRLRNFIKKYEPYIQDMTCSMWHCSHYDN